MRLIEILCFFKIHNNEIPLDSILYWFYHLDNVQQYFVCPNKWSFLEQMDPIKEERRKLSMNE